MRAKHFVPFHRFRYWCRNKREIPPKLVHGKQEVLQLTRGAAGAGQPQEE